MNKTKMYTCLALFILGLANLQAQNNNNLIVFSETGDRFYLVLNGLKYNDKPETNVKVTNLNATNYKAKILFENGHPDLDHNVYLMWEGNAVTNKEFTYAVSRKENKYKLRFISQADIGTSNANSTNSVVYNANGTAYGSNTSVNTTTNADANVNANTTQISTGVNGGGYNSSTTVTTTTTTGTNGQNGNVGMNVNVDGLNMSINVNGTGAGTNVNSNANSSTSVTTTSTSYATSTMSSGGSGTMQSSNTALNSNVQTTSGGCAGSMNDGSFNDLVTSINAKSFEDAKLKIAKQGVSSNCVSAAQVRKLMDLFSFEENKLNITKYCYDYTTDKNNYFKVNDGFTFDASVDELNAYVSSKK